MTNQIEKSSRHERRLSPLSILKTVSIALLGTAALVKLTAKYADYLQQSYDVTLKEPSEENQQEKSQAEILKESRQLLAQGNSVIVCIMPHTSLIDHIVANSQVEAHFADFDRAWMASKKFATGEMGIAGRLANARNSLDKRLTMFYVTQAYLRDGMSEDDAKAAASENGVVVQKLTTYLKEGKNVLFFYPEGTRVQTLKKDGVNNSVNLARAHPRAFEVAERSGEDAADKSIYLLPMILGDMPVGKEGMRKFLPGGKVDITYGAPINISQMRREFSIIEGKIRFTAEVLKYHSQKNPCKKRLVSGGVKQIGHNGEKLYEDAPDDFGFADYVMWKSAKLMPKEKRGIYSDECVTIDE